MIAGIIEFVKELLAAIPIINKWITKTTEEKVEGSASDVQEEKQDVQSGGRPKWD